MVRLRISINDQEGIEHLGDFITFFEDKAQTKEYLWHTYNGLVNYTGKECFILSPYGDVIEVEEIV